MTACLLLILMLFGALGLLKLSEFFFMYKKQKPVRSKVKCPLDQTRELKDFELHFGHCYSCPLSQQKACGADIKKQIENECPSK